MSAAPTLGSLMRAERRSRAWTQEMLAEASLVSIRTIGDIESGRQRRPRRETLDDLIRALGPAPDHEAAIRVAWHGGEPADELPLPLDPFIGRGAEVARVRELLDATRLLTLTGLAGVGKTRLALAATRPAPSRFERVVFVALAGTLQEDDVAPVVLARLGGRPVRDDAPRAVAALLAGTSTLLVLDTAEHVRGAVTSLAEHILAFEGASMLVTSQLPLGVAHERVLGVEPLPAADALALLVERAERAGAKALDARDDLTAICERLDRLPLAIELAAPRLRTLTPRALLERLARSSELLVAEPGRHRYATLHEAVAWSYAQLTLREQEVLRGLSTFAGAWPIVAAEDLLGPAVVADLDRLVAANFITRMEHGDGRARYWVLGTIRDYVRSLVDRDESERWTRLRVTCAAKLVRRVTGEVEAPAQLGGAIVRAIDACIEDTMSAAEHAAALPMLSEGIEIIARLGRYWPTRARATWALRLLRSLLAAAEADTGVAPEVVAMGYRSVPTLIASATEADVGAGLRAALRALELTARLGDDQRTQSYLALTFAAALAGDVDRAIEAGLAGVDAARSFGRAHDVAVFFGNLALAEDGRGDASAARGWGERAVRAFEALDDTAGLLRAESVLALLDARAGNRDGAIRHSRRAFALARHEHDPAARTSGMRRVALAIAALGHPGRALRVALAAAREAAEGDASYDVAETADALAFVAEVSHAAEAVTALAIADARRERPGFRPYPADVQRRDALRARLRARLGPHAFTMAEDDAVTRGMRNLLARLARPAISV